MAEETTENPGEGEAPPAADVVIKSPRELKLEQDVEAANTRAKNAEIVAAENEEKLKQLIEGDSRRPKPTPAATPAAKPKKEKMNVRFPTILHEAADEDEGES